MTPYRTRSSTVRKQKRERFFQGLIQSPKITPALLMMAGVMLGIGGFLYLWQWAHYLNEGYQVQKLQKHKLVLKEETEMLELEVNYLSRPERLERIALKQLKLKYPNASQLRNLPDQAHPAETPGLSEQGP